MKGCSIMNLMKKYATCPSCGKESLGNGEGALIIEDEWFYRGCDCGYQIVVNEEDLPLDLNLVKPYLKQKQP